GHTRDCDGRGLGSGESKSSHEDAKARKGRAASSCLCVLVRTCLQCYDPRMGHRPILHAALAYWAAIFALGFVLGTVRTLWLAPAVGELAAVALELPVMLGASAWAA